MPLVQLAFPSKQPDRELKCPAEVRAARATNFVGERPDIANMIRPTVKMLQITLASNKGWPRQLPTQSLCNMNFCHIF